MHLKTTPLFEKHKDLKAKLAPFAGWLMPIQYTSILEEHHWTRKHCSLFDTCHMGEILIYGRPEESGLDRLVTMNLSQMPVGKCAYGFMLNEDGGIIDDLIVYKLAEDKWMLVVNAGPLAKDEAHLKTHIKTKVENISDTTAKLDLQGPLSREILKQWVGEEIERLKYYHFAFFSLLGEEVLISRTGYTGELGFEFYIKAEKAKALWDLFLSDGRVRPAGLGARDTLRLEMGYPLYGQDISEETTPLEAGLGRFIDFEKDFIGKDVLLRQREEGIKRKLVGFVTNSRRAPRHGYKIYVEEKEVGFVTSGTFSPSLSCGIGMGYVEIEYAKTDQLLSIRQDRIEIEAMIRKRPFYRDGSLLT